MIFARFADEDIGKEIAIADDHANCQGRIRHIVPR